ncbi:MAG TPA: exodeoxyribonuclease VII large subunit [Candidatus Cloacimonadota bacterium]|jgi:exodeoxyribonuclease VII large subunit|nr:exodeoxyribonuclease VII large subunit [Candidatus Cloacimonadota bacterium]HOF59525.1 exodeoxyribonuclease VII large subunit [Candidatus Cloacimonadota bacterium]HOR58762.1 exodeoxyribonuclease VII large subunit [Candidatus Cloacimonadota bacterium]HPB08085.1 exodeoxyribonuclease VII large subunit [Candidatus Cloacimonadota bacterium]HQL13484.1 exodeoxyribonuclease VII large subunit [Candidatus Cloacimonadota bacterium]
MTDELIVFSVFEITSHLKQVIETQIEPLYIRGEVSNYTRHSSGHLYFNLKDDNSTLRCTFFRYANLTLDFEPENGMEVICFGKLTVYEKGGTYSLNVQSMSLAGKGELALRFELLKKKLQEEGLFDPAAKQALPRYPRRIGIVTSPTGAALQDIRNVLTRRFPVEVDVFPAQVQGTGAPAQLIAGIKYFNRAKDVDLIILTRGGGSQEDLFCFNDEKLAREIFASRLPVISAVGHEIDFTIADFVADLRAPTPSAAAEIAVPDKADLLAYLASLESRMKIMASSNVDRCRSVLSESKLAFARLNPERLWLSMNQRVDMANLALLQIQSSLKSRLHQLELRKSMAENKLKSHHAQYKLITSQRLKEMQMSLRYAISLAMLENKNHLEQLRLRLEGYSPHRFLDRGCCFVSKDGKPVSSIEQISPEDMLKLLFKDGSSDVKVTNVHPRGLADDEK